MLTGDELVPPGRPLSTGQIHETSGITLRTLARRAGAEVILGVRPEHVSIRTDGAGLPAAIEIDEPMGSDSLIWLTFAGVPLRARTTADHGLANGQSVHVAFDITRASLFDQKTELRL